MLQTGRFAGIRKYRLLSVSLALALLAGSLAAPRTSAEPLGAASEGSVAREGLLTPAELGDGTVDGLQYPDVTEGLAMVQPPEANSGGGAQLEYPLVIPPGRGITPDLSLSYDSGGGDGWVGLGWDLSVGEISVDTSFGAPHFNPDFESESYLLDGAVLVPTAIDDAWEARELGDRQDYTRQQETEYEQIIRHEVPDHDGGADGGPDDYYWEVRDQGGNVRWYGGHPDEGGPDGNLRSTGETIDRSAIVYDDNKNAVKWLLSAQRDVGVNQITYYYKTVNYEHTPAGWRSDECGALGVDTLHGQHTYLESINYTEAAEVAPDPAWDGDAAYQVHLIRESEAAPCSRVREDPIVDAIGGYVDVVADRLARVEVMYGDPLPLGAARTYDQLAAKYVLEYTDGPFSKSLLSAVTQVADPVADSARHEFDYSNNVGGEGGADYDGFETTPDIWNTGEDMASRLLLGGNQGSNVSPGVLGTSESNSAEGHAYIGFNLTVPQKVGSFGVGFQIGAGGTEALGEWIDLNGDNLPDKVFRDGNTIRFRLNESGPDGGDNFSGGQTATAVGGDIPRLSRDISVNFQLSVEVYFGITFALGIGGDIAIGDSYFTDVNADGLPDFVSAGSVYFNRLVGGVPTFEKGSAGTVVPLPTGGAIPDMNVTRIADVQADLAAQSPLVDTVRRWTAPFTGDVSIDAPVTFTGVNSQDGVRVAIEHSGSPAPLAVSSLVITGNHVFDAAIPLSVTAGEHVYFRVGSVGDGANDQVSWNPIITYTDPPAAADDPNGLSQLMYSAADDFTLAGRPNSVAVVPYTGNIRFTTTVTKSAITSDDLKVVVKHNGTEIVVPGATIDKDFVGAVIVSADLAVDGPEYPTELEPLITPSQDTVEAYLAVDSPIDLTAIDWQPTLFYLNAVDSAGVALEVFDANNDPNFVVDLLPEIEQYPNSSRISPATPLPGDDGTYDLAFTINRPFLAPDGMAIVTVKNADGGLVKKEEFNLGLGLGANSYVVNLDATLTSGTEYFFDVMIRDPKLSDGVSLGNVALRPDGATDDTTDVDVPDASALRWRGRQTIFPLAYRGWAVAGYTAPGAKATALVNPAAFVVDESGFDDAAAPTGWGDLDENDPGANVEPAYAFVPFKALPSLPGKPPAYAGPVWRGPRDNLAVTKTLIRSSRLGTDSVEIGGTSESNGEGAAITRIGLAIPTVSLAVGIGPFGGSLGIGPSFGLVDYEDMNGDGYPDVITPGHIQYTDQRGSFLAQEGVDDMAVSNQDLTISTSVGLSVQLVDIKSNTKGKTNATQGSASGKGGDANDSSGGVGIGGDVSFSWTSPNASISDVSSDYDPDDLEGAPADATGGADIQTALADVNGDGLPDRVRTNTSGVFVQYNLGYGFTDESIQLAGGGFESMESAAWTASLGFSTPWAEFSGGVAINTSYDQARYTWRDVNGDGILDQVHQQGGSNPPLVAFGTGSDMLDPVEYGSTATVDGSLGYDGQQVAFDRSTGLGGGFDFTVYIGPLCLVACYLIINPGASFQNSVSTTEVDLQDVDGDGYADSVKTTNDNQLKVLVNKHGDTNLLTQVKNPLGGSMDLTYKRDGNTVDSPDSIWSLSRVDVNDGRPGDGANLQSTTYEYDGMQYDRVNRQSLGYSTIVAKELNTEAADAVMRVTTTQYYNDNVFNAGLQHSVVIAAPGGAKVREATSTYGFRDVLIQPADMHAQVGLNLDPTTIVHDVASRGRSITPLVTRTDEKWYENGVEVESTFMTFTYDGLGNVLTHFDDGESGDATDNLEVTYIYSNCEISSTMDPQCPSTPNKPSTLFAETLCPTWVSLPVTITVTNGGSITYRHRDGRGSVCDNASMTHLEETINGSGDVATTELTYDEWGSYDRIVYPSARASDTPGQPTLDLTQPDEECILVPKDDDEGVRYAVRYVYDESRHSNIASVTEYDLGPDSVQSFLCEGTLMDDGVEGLTSTATFDGLSGRVESRTDANDNVTHYTYDSLARIESISSPRPGDALSLITYEYHQSAAGYAYAKASHLDFFSDDLTDTIDTYSFVDGIGRVTQTKRDATLFQGAGLPAVDGRSVSGATRFDALGRATDQFLPSQDTGAASAYLTTETGPVETTTWDIQDRPLTMTAPGIPARVTTFSYGSSTGVLAGPELFATTVTEPNLRVTTTYSDVRDMTRAIYDKPALSPAPLRSAFQFDGMGQLLNSLDQALNLTTHTYDMLGRRTSSQTPDGGLIGFGFDAEGKLTSKITPNLRTAGVPIAYAYEFGKLVSINYPGTTPDVTYQYGLADADSDPDTTNGAGRVIREEDGSRIVTTEYAPTGAMTKQLAEMKYHDWFNATDKSAYRWTTEWTYDGLGRMATMTYPDSEVLTYDYDSGGLAKSISGVEEGFEKVLVGIDPITFLAIYEDQPRTWTYDYLADRQYDEFMRLRWQELGNGVTTEYTFDQNTQWLSRQQSMSPERDVTNPAYFEIQDLNYTYDSVGNPTVYRNNLPPAVSNQFGGSSVQRYRYDPQERVVGGTGVYDLADKRHQRYEFSVSYDANGNVKTKNQYDATVRSPVDLVNPPGLPGTAKGKNADLVNTKNTFSFTRDYKAAPTVHQATKVGTDTYSYDKNGNLLGIKDSRGKWIRQIQWDAADRMVLVTDGPSSTEYRYDDTGQRAIERGPAGETATVNPWVTTRNRNEMYKHIWVDDDRIATKRDDGGYEELKRYFLHKDLQGSTNVVTDAGGETFQHHEYFPNGDVWIDEKSTVFRTPYQFGGGYIDEVRDIANFGARWYDQNRELFYSPDSVLVDDPMAVMGKPMLASAYAYAGSNPLTNVDPSGNEFYTSATRGGLKAKHAEARAFIGRNPAVAAAIVSGLDTRLPRGLVAAALNNKRADRLQAFSEALDAKPIVEIDPKEGTVKLSLGIGKRVRIPANKKPDPASNANVAANNVPVAADARGSTGGPAVGPGGGGKTGATAPDAPAPPTTGAQKANDSAPVQPRPRSNSSPAALGGGGSARADE